MDRDRLARRIETEAWAHAKADHHTRDFCMDRVLGFLEVGVHARLVEEGVRAGGGAEVMRA